MKSGKIIISFIVFSLFYLSNIVIAQENVEKEDVVYLKKGDIIRGNILEHIIGKQLKIEIMGGSILVFKDDEIEKVTKLPKLNNNTTKSKYGALGILLGTPGGLNLTSAYFANQFGLRFLAGTNINDMYGFELDLEYILTSEKHYYASIDILGGYSYLGKYYTYLYDNYNAYSISYIKDWLYLGAEGNLNFYGFNISLGLSFGSGYFSSPQLIANIGYVYRFND
jgi:hypothetical protein